MTEYKGIDFTKVLDSTPEEAILHYGVKGMKWGVRKDKGSRITATPNKGSVKSKTITDSITSSKKGIIATTLASLAMPVIPIFIMAMETNATKQAKISIANSFNKPVSEFNKKDLNSAAKLVKRHSNVKVTMGDMSRNVKNLEAWKEWGSDEE